MHLAMDVLVLVGTMKGAFFLRSRDRDRWDVSGPHFAGHTVYALAYDGRGGRRRLWAADHSHHWGAVLRSSDDLGNTWSNPERATIKFPDDTKGELKQIWQIALDGADTIYAGVEPGALFVSSDAGQSFELVRGLWNHPHRAQWMPGGGGLCLHTIIPAGKRITIAVSAGGCYRSDDGGETWQARNQNIRVPFLPAENQYPEFGHCVHKIVRHPAKPDRLFLQHHWGVYRSDDAGDTWVDIGKGKLPSDFGFALAAHPTQPDTAYILPIQSDEFRVTPDARLRVYRTRDAGETWEPLARGLPQEGAYECVLRDGMATDGETPAGVYFGTRSGKVYGSRDDGDGWSRLVDGLPPVVCVKTVALS